MADNNIDDKTLLLQELKEDWQRERAEAWWKKYNGLIIGGALAIIIATGGYSAYENHIHSRQQKATFDLLNITADKDEAQLLQKLQSFQGAHDETAQNFLARYFEASLMIKQGQTTEGLTIYETLRTDKNVPAEFRDLAALSYAQNELDAGDPKKLMPLLQAIADRKGVFQYSAREYLGLLEAKIGQPVAAAKRFEALSVDPAAPESIRARALHLARLYAELPSTPAKTP
jgi:hypothetical protein